MLNCTGIDVMVPAVIVVDTMFTAAASNPNRVVVPLVVSNPVPSEGAATNPHL